MAPKQPCAKYQYVVTSSGPKILPVEEPSCKDEESPADYNTGGYLPVKVADSFKQGRYRVLRKLGWGHFSTVWLVKDSLLDRHSALKVVKSAGRYAETARDEIKLLSRVESFSPTHPGRAHIVSFLDSFSHTGPEASHVCIVFEPLGENLLALIERHKKKGVPRALVKVIAKQILLGLEYLHDECDLVHTDIKPENILISIPDIESHIHNELSQSPTPTSRRVGVPLPTKSRAGVSIPHNHQRTSRRQVQIFDSQPLASPGRSAGTGGRHENGSLSQGGSGSNSVNGSYVPPVHIAKLAAHGVLGQGNGTAASAPKVPSTLSTSAPGTNHTTTLKSSLSKSNANPPVTTTDPKPQPNLTSPSTSSSSSSISSTLASTAAGPSSIVSTPPTSLSYSLGSAMAGFIGMSKRDDKTDGHASHVKIEVVRTEDEGCDERVGVPMKGKCKGKGKVGLESDLDCTTSSSWKDKFASGIGMSLSWKDRISASSSCKSSASPGSNKSKRPHAHSHGHPRRESHSGILVSSPWQDPGAAAPAPALVVSANVSADGEEGGDYFLALGGGASISARSTATSESSSATVTKARPSPNGTPYNSLVLQEDSSNPNKGGNINSITESLFSNSISDPAATKNQANTTANTTCNTNINSHPSLLTQTAPSKAHIPNPISKRSNTRTSPNRHTSQLSAHLHTHPPYSNPNNHDNINPANSQANNHKPPMTSTTTRDPLSPSSLTPTPASPPLAAPPSTPNVLPPSLSYLGSAPIEIQESSPPPPPAPPISIKIADLGNATPSTKHYTEDIQTRQYRAPEAILGRKDWGAKVDIWSVACVIFELLTAEYLFDPQGQGELFSKDDDHMAQIIELLGDFSMETKMGGKYSRELFDHTGALRYIRTLKPWPLKRVMTEKYLFSESDAAALCEFLEPMLVVDMKERTGAKDMVAHQWLGVGEADGIIGEW